MALVFWSEPIATFDIDVFVLLQSGGPLLSLAPVYEWARKNGYAGEAEHIIIAGIPVQIIPAPNEIAEEAITTAAELDYAGQPVRVIRPGGHISGTSLPMSFGISLRLSTLCLKAPRIRIPYAPVE